MWEVHLQLIQLLQKDERGDDLDTEATADQHLCGSEERNRTQSRTSMMQAMLVAAAVRKMHVSGQSYVEQWRNSYPFALLNYALLKASASQSVGRSKIQLNKKF